MSFYVIIRGPLGIGKSTVAKTLSKKIGAEHVSIDKILKEEDSDHIDEQIGYIPEENFKKANGIAVDRTRAKIMRGKPIVYDGNFYWKTQMNNLVSRLNCRHYVFTLKADLETCIDRDSKRKKPLGKEATMVVYKKVTEFNYGEVIDTEGKSVEEVVSEIIGMIEE